MLVLFELGKVRNEMVSMPEKEIGHEHSVIPFSDGRSKVALRVQYFRRRSGTGIQRRDHVPQTNPVKMVSNTLIEDVVVVFTLISIHAEKLSLVEALKL